MAGFLNELGQLCGLNYYPNRGVFNSKQGMAVGFKEGLIVAAGVVSDGIQKNVAVLLRGAQVNNQEALKNALSHNDGMKKVARGATTFNKDSVIWKFRWPIGLKAEKLAPALEAMVAAASPFIQPLRRGACEHCASSAPMLLVNGIPGMLCDQHKAAISQEQSAHAAAYDASEPNITRGVLFAALATLACVLVWGIGGAWLDYWWNGTPVKLLCIMPFLLVMAVAKATQVGLGKINSAGVFTVTLFSFVAVFGSDIVFLAENLGIQHHVPFDRAIKVVLSNLIAAKWGAWTEKLITAFQAFSVIAAPYVYKAMKPKFDVVFEPLGTSNVLASAPVSVK